MLAFAETHGATREGAEEVVALLSSWLRDLAVMKSGAGALVNADLQTLAKVAASKRSEVELHRAERALSQMLEEITTRNAQPRLQMERALIRIVEGVA